MVVFSRRLQNTRQQEYFLWFQPSFLGKMQKPPIVIDSVYQNFVKKERGVSLFFVQNLLARVVFLPQGGILEKRKIFFLL